MISTLLSIIFVYLFIALGFLAKQLFRERIDSKTLTITSLFFLQPFVSVWGFSSAPLSASQLYAPLIYLAIIVSLLIPNILLAKVLFRNPKERAIYTIAGFVGNTGNIGIPLGIALFGESSVIYTTLINIANVLVVYTLGVYIYSRGSFGVKESLLNIVKIPIIPASAVAITINISGIELSAQIKEFLKMGAYSGIVIQLFLLGTFLESIKIKKLNTKLLTLVLTHKFLLIPLTTAALLYFLNLPPMVKGVIFIQMLTPLAVANINLSSLYDCQPQDVTALILFSTLLFMPILALFATFGFSFTVI
ncbi:MAG TPA: transporter [Nitratifractor sp.]|nr:transporter [Nitratifractor sp.]